MNDLSLFSTLVNQEKCIYEFIIREKKNIIFDFTKIFKPQFLILFLLFIPVISIPANAADYYVATSGSDKNSGTLDSPLRNISYAVNQAIAGDTIYLIGGTWSDEHIIFSNSGTKDNPIRLIKYNGTVILDGVDQTGYGIYVKNESNLIVDGIELRNYCDGFYLGNNISDIELSNFTISDVYHSGINFYGNGKSSVFNVLIHDFKISKFGGQTNTYCGGILHEFGLTNSHDIEIYNFDIRDANYNGAGIRFREADKVHIHNGGIYNMASGQDGIFFGSSLDNSIVENITINNTGWHGIGLNSGNYITDTDEEYLHNNTIRNCVIGYSSHNSIDFHTGNVNPIVENVTLFGVPEGLVGINYMHNGTGLTVRNATIYGLKNAMYLTQPNASIWDCTVNNISSYSVAITNPNVSVNNCNFSNPNSDYTFVISDSADKYTINNTRIGEGKTVRVKTGSGKLLDIIDTEYKISGNNASVTVEYTDGKVFSVTKSPYVSSPLWTPNCSYVEFNASVTATTIKITSYPMTVRPSTEPIYINVNKFDTSLSEGNILINFTVNSPEKNNVLFNIGGLKPENYYLIKKENLNFTSLKANSSGYIQFSDSEWSTSYTFTIEEISFSSEDDSPSYISPISSAGSDQTIPFGSIVCFNGSGSTGDNISYEWDFDASNGIQSEATGAIVNHTYETPGVYTVTLTVTDANGNTDSDTCTITVLEKSEATKICISSPNASLPGKTFTVDILVDPTTPITGTQLDFIFDSSMASVNNVTEGDLLKQSGAYTIFSSGTIDNSAGTVKNIYSFILGTSNVSSSGTFATINLTARSKTGIAEFSISNILISDSDSESAPYNITNATVLIDTAPVMSEISCPESVDETSTLTFKVSAKDADCDKLTLSVSGLPEGASFNKTSGAFSWTPAIGQAGVYTMTFEVSDGYLTDSENVTVTVNKLNNPPVINSFEPLNGSSFSEGERIEISVNASDSDEQALNYSIIIDGIVYSTDTEYIWETDYSSSGYHTIEAVVSDGTDEVKEQHTIYISECHPRWDVNEDGRVNILDITIVSKKYGTTVSNPYPRYDVNQDGAVNILDLSLVGSHFGEIVN